jgi:hypothetical protein
LGEEQLKAFSAWLSNEEYGYFAEIAQNNAENELRRAIRDPKPGENPDSLYLDRERALAKLQIHRYYANLKETVSSLISANPTKTAKPYNL